jgi:hypothetical protein
VLGDEGVAHGDEIALRQGEALGQQLVDAALEPRPRGRPAEQSEQQQGVAGIRRQRAQPDADSDAEGLVLRSFEQKERVAGGGVHARRALGTRQMRRARICQRGQRLVGERPELEARSATEPRRRNDLFHLEAGAQADGDADAPDQQGDDGERVLVGRVGIVEHEHAAMQPPPHRDGSAGDIAGHGRVEGQPERQVRQPAQRGDAGHERPAARRTRRELGHERALADAGLADHDGSRLALDRVLEPAKLRLTAEEPRDHPASVRPGR